MRADALPVWSRPLQTSRMLSDARIAALDAAIREALRSGTTGNLDLIGAGALTCVVAWDGVACKRLPPQNDVERVRAYGALVERYVAALTACGLHVLPTTMRYAAHAGRYAAVMLQPRIPREDLLPAVLRRSPPTVVAAYLTTILDHVDQCVRQGIGIDPQVANWCLVDGHLTLVDVTTPMLRDDAGRDALDSEVFVALLPTLLRPVARRFLVQDMLDRNFVHRRILLDLVGNIVNDGLAALTPQFISAANARLAPGDAPITAEEVEAYRRSERLTWTILSGAFRIEAWWRRWVTRRPADHLLPSAFTG
jgi:hypothetical protein